MRGSLRGASGPRQSARRDSGQGQAHCEHVASSRFFRPGDQTDDHREARQRLPSPVAADVGEEPVFDLVPLACPGGGKWETVIESPGRVASCCSSHFHSRTREPLLPPCVRRDQNRSGVRVCGSPHRSTGGTTKNSHMYEKVLYHTYKVAGVSNAMAEAKNARIQRIKNMACGFRNRKRFRMAILFHLGGLSLMPKTLKYFGILAHTDAGNAYNLSVSP